MTSRAWPWLVGGPVVLAVAIAAVAGRTRSPSTASPPAPGQRAPTPAPVPVPPPLPGEPPLSADHERMLTSFAANISQGLYTPANLMFLLCNSEAGLAIVSPATDPAVHALMRRMVQLFRSAPGMAHAGCPTPPSP